MHGHHAEAEGLLSYRRAELRKRLSHQLEGAGKCEYAFGPFFPAGEARPLRSRASVHPLAMRRTIPGGAIPATTAAASSPAAAAVLPPPLLGRVSVRTGLRRGSLRRRGQGGARLGRGARCHLILAVLQLGDQDQTAVAGLDDELAEPIEAGIPLIEIRVDLLHDLLQPVRAHDIAVAGHLGNRLTGELPGIPLGGWGIDFLGESGQIVVRVVLVAVLNQEVAGRLSYAHSDHVLPVLLQLDD